MPRRRGPLVCGGGGVCQWRGPLQADGVEAGRAHQPGDFVHIVHMQAVGGKVHAVRPIWRAPPRPTHHCPVSMTRKERERGVGVQYVLSTHMRTRLCPSPRHIHQLTAASLTRCPFASTM
jgi:hypothetical protein